MVTTSGDLGYMTLDKYTKNTTKSVEILNNILGVNKETAKTILLYNYHLNEEQTEDVLRYTHPNNPRPFVILTSTDSLLGRGQSVFNFGEWNFSEDKGGNYIYSVGNFIIKKDILNSTNGVLLNRVTDDITWSLSTGKGSDKLFEDIIKYTLSH